MWFSKLDWVCPAVAFNFQALLASFFLQYVWLAIFNGNIYIYCCSFLSSWGLSVSFIISSIPPNILNHYFAVLKNKKKIITKEEIAPPFFATGISFVSFFVEFWKQKHELHLLGLCMQNVAIVINLSILSSSRDTFTFVFVFWKSTHLCFINLDFQPTWNISTSFKYFVLHASINSIFE